MSSHENVIYLADHSVVLALPALIPAFIIVGVVLYIVARDRRAERREAEESSDGPSRGEDSPTDEKENR